MIRNEGEIRFGERKIAMDTLNGYLLNTEIALKDQSEAYYANIGMVRDFLDIFRRPHDPSLALYQIPSPARIPSQEFTQRGLVSEAGTTRINSSKYNDEVWVSFETKKNTSGYKDIITMSYIARYPSYEEMRQEIVRTALPGQEDRITSLLPAVDFGLEDNHVTLEEVYELEGWELTEAKKRFTGFHFHMPNSERRVGFVPETNKIGEQNVIELAVPSELSPRAFNRVFCGIILPILRFQSNTRIAPRG